MQTGILGQGDKRRKASSNVVKLIKANQNDHGFVGWIGLVIGHPMLLNHQMASEQAVSRAGSTVTFEDFCAGLGGDVTLKAATEAWNKSRTAEITALAPATVSVTAPATVSVTSDEQSVSLISHQSSVSSISHQSSVSSTAMSTVSKKSTANAKKSTAEAKKLASQAPPRTPERRKRDAVTGTNSSSETPRCIALGTDAAKRWGCQSSHELHRLDSWEKSYMHFSHLKKYPTTRPEKCCCCRKKFTIGPMKLRERNEDEYVQYRRGDKVYGCNNSMRNDHDCKFLFCDNCRATLLEELKEHSEATTPPRISKKPKSYSPS